uniref:Period circadian protein n=1 Tax=Taenia asiatica TaxID=60517 RepID=A0A0R3WG55_TAEAS
LKKITADILKKLTLYLPPASSSTLRSLDLTPFHSDSLQLSGSSGDRLANKTTKLEEARQKLFSTHNNHQPEFNGISPCSNDTKSQEHDSNAEGDSGSYEASSSKEASKNGESGETRFFTNGNAMVSSS